MVPETQTNQPDRHSTVPAGKGRPQLRDSLTALEGLVESKDVDVAFQPIVRLADGFLFAYEALARCSVQALADPVVLFERAVSARCAGRLGRLIREIAVPRCSDVPIFLNIHPQELNEGWLVRPDDPIALHDQPVFLEITESVPLTHFDLCLTVLREIRERAGVELVVDDLGAGYSNLKRIADLEPSIVKLDRGLIAGLARSKRQHQLVSSVVRMCTEMNASVVAEGVETLEEFSAVRDTGSHYAQGYLLARPGFPLPKVSWPGFPAPGLGF